MANCIREEGNPWKKRKEREHVIALKYVLTSVRQSIFAHHQSPFLLVVYDRDLSRCANVDSVDLLSVQKKINDGTVKKTIIKKKR